jgi:hypothetical protein
MSWSGLCLPWCRTSRYRRVISSECIFSPFREVGILCSDPDYVLPEGSLQWRRCSRQSKHPDAQHIQFFFCFVLFLQTSSEVLPNQLPYYVYLAPRPSRRASNLASQLHPGLCNGYASPLGVVKLGVYKFFDPDWVYLDALHPDTEGSSHPNKFVHLSGKLVPYARIRITSYLQVHCNGTDVADKVNTLMHTNIQFFFCFVLFLQTSSEVLPNQLPYYVYLAPRPSRRASNLASQLHPWLCNDYASPLGVVKLWVYKFLDLDWVYLDARHWSVVSSEWIFSPFREFCILCSDPDYVLPEGSLQWRRCSRQSKHPDAQHIQFFFWFILFLQTSIEVLPNLYCPWHFLQANYLLTIGGWKGAPTQRSYLLYISHV